MNCKKAERWMLRSFDGLLKEEEKEKLASHLSRCLRCQGRERDYRGIFTVLKKVVLPEKKPFFWERLQPRLREKEKDAPWSFWKELSIKAIPLSLALITCLILAMMFLSSRKQEELSQSEILLLRNMNPIQETRTLFEEEKLENRNMMLIFASMEEKTSVRRYWP